MSETCDACGFQYEAIYRVPNDVWLKICPKRQVDYRDAPGGGLLCMECAWRRARDAGHTLYFDAHDGWWPLNSNLTEHPLILTEGYNLVPVEPTYRMTKAGKEAFDQFDGKRDEALDVAYRAMIAEAPQRGGEYG